MEMKTVMIEDLIPYENNPRSNETAVPAVAASIQDVGYITPIVVDENMVVLAGHTRLEALKSVGGVQCEVIVCDGLTEEQKRKYRILDNKVSEFAVWDYDALRVESEGLDFSYDFGIDGLLEKGEELKKTKEKKNKKPAMGKTCTCPGCGKQWEE